MTIIVSAVRVELGHICKVFRMRAGHIRITHIYKTIMISKNKNKQRNLQDKRNNDEDFQAKWWSM